MREIKFRAWYYNGIDLSSGDMRYDVAVKRENLAFVRDTDLLLKWSNCV